MSTTERPLVKKALEIIKERADVLQKKQSEVLSAQEKEKASILFSFEKEFKDELPMLMESGIDYKVLFDTDYPDHSYMQFYVKDPMGKQFWPFANMDFKHEPIAQWRYEFSPIPQVFNNEYGRYSKEDFILYIAHVLFGVNGKTKTVTYPSVKAPTHL